jgi:hypothetical protein
VLLAIGMNDININAIELELIVELLRAILGLNKDEHWRLEARADQLAESGQLAILSPRVHDLLIDSLSRSVADPDLHFQAVMATHYTAPHFLLNPGLHGGTEQTSGTDAALAPRYHFMHLF